jgi:hypothetical protein
LTSGSFADTLDTDNSSADSSGTLADKSVFSSVSSSMFSGAVSLAGSSVTFSGAGSSEVSI